MPVDVEVLHQAMVRDISNIVQEQYRSYAMKTLLTEYCASWFLMFLLVLSVCLVELASVEDLAREEDRCRRTPAACPGGHASGRPKRRPRYSCCCQEETISEEVPETYQEQQQQPVGLAS